MIVTDKETNKQTNRHRDQTTYIIQSEVWGGGEWQEITFVLYTCQKVVVGGGGGMGDVSLIP